jgi:hypothetical protein
MTLLKEIWSKHLLLFSTLILIKTYVDFTWFLNVYTLQGNELGTTSVFLNGIILGCVSLFAVSTSGLIMRYFNPTSLQLSQAIVCLLISAYLLVCIIYNDQMTED